MLAIFDRALAARVLERIVRAIGENGNSDLASEFKALGAMWETAPMDSHSNPGCGRLSRFRDGTIAASGMRGFGSQSLIIVRWIATVIKDSNRSDYGLQDGDAEYQRVTDAMTDAVLKLG